MSCDFGPIPMPTSPLQTYWEEQYFTRSSTADQSRSAPVTKPEKNNIAPELMEALEKLAEQRRRDEQGEYTPQRKAADSHRRGSSFGQRLWSTITGEQSAPRKVLTALWSTLRSAELISLQMKQS